MTNLVSISSVVAGDHPEGTIVTVTGVLNGMQARKTKQGNDWATFLLIDDKTAVDVAFLPATYVKYRDLVGPVKDPDPNGGLRPPTLTLTGRVIRPGWPSTWSCRPSLYVDEVFCAAHDSHKAHPPIAQARPASAPTGHRETYIAGLRDLAAWLEANPDLTPEQTTNVTIPMPADDAVRVFAARHGLTTHTGACAELCWLTFGPIKVTAMSWAPDATERLIAATERLGDL